ncbi:ATP-dependent helicase [Epidermidibacterium keratini]|uniref:ATP-dependent helicase n=1 Tax=Epidermidibacterium keratini TaxID=1891644 RepID=A0A7L4YS89_9ACTN|nr:ATP-dependent helicase [Epidermidibacterium keratini]QHC01918.1 ATP-dependent helicase [Epidermidibacterium keratini]
MFTDFAPATRAWFTTTFREPTPAQAGAWEAIGSGDHALVVAPTGSGKTLAAFLSAIDRLSVADEPAEPLRRCRVLYISPLKALASDVERNLRAPLVGIANAATRLGTEVADIRVSTRTADTTAAERRAFARTPGDILITTPESLFLLLTSQAREALRGIDTVIIDEIHAIAGTKRGAHLMLSLEHLDSLLEAPAQRIGLSATVRPIDEVARFLGGSRPVRVIDPPAEKSWELEVVVPVEDMSDLSDQSAADGTLRRSIWPAVEDRIYDLVREHRSTIVFSNSRRSAERLTSRLNELAADAVGDPSEAPSQIVAQSGVANPVDDDLVIARSHHGSVSHEQRRIVEEALKLGQLPAVVATSSLELGIDMGAVDLVVQVESPPSVASGLQRVGRAGHQVGAASHGVFFPKHRGDLVATAVVVDRMYDGDLEPLQVPQNPLDVLAQQLVSMLSQREYDVEELFALVRRAAPYATLPESAFHGVLDMLAGRYPSEHFASLRPRIVWDRTTGQLRARPGAARAAIISGGTIPDRGLFGVYLAGADGERGGRRVGELDEEMVYESRVGDVFLLGTTTWRIVEITHDRVLVVPAPGVPGRMPFWKGEQQGRPLPLGRAIGEFLRALDAGESPAALDNLDDYARSNLQTYVAAQREATGVVPSDRQIVIERFRDELGDWRVVVHSPFGDRVNAPWALMIGERLHAEYGADAQAMHTDDGIVLRVPDMTGTPPGRDGVLVDPDDVARLVTEQLSGSALFAGRFRECAARALLLPRRNPGKRAPLWQQRQRASQLLTVAAEYDDFPIVLETLRECFRDVYDVPGLVEVLSGVRDRSIGVHEVETSGPSPFAQSLLFGYVGAFIYADDMPLAERRASVLSLDTAVLRELLGQVELHELLDADVIAEVTAAVSWRTPERELVDTERLADALRVLGELSADDITSRGGSVEMAAALVAERRAIEVGVAGEVRWAAVEDAGLLRDALGIALPPGIPQTFTEPVPDALSRVLARYARTHGPFTAGEVAARFGLGESVARAGIDALTAGGELTAGLFEAGQSAHQWCDAEVLRRMRRRSLARSRAEVEPVDTRDYARFLPAWQRIGDRSVRGADGLYQVIEQLSGAPLAASSLESLVLPARVTQYSPALLDELTAAGEVVWFGAGEVGSNDGVVRLVTADALPALDAPALPTSELDRRVYDAFAPGHAVFFRDLLAAVRESSPGEVAEADVTDALWRLVWGGHVTGDTLAPLRARLGGNRRARASVRRGRRSVRVATPVAPSVGGRWSLVPYEPLPETERKALHAELLVERYGVLTRGSVQAEEVAGGFAGIYPVLAAYEDSGRLRRGYFIEGLGAAQFATTGAIDRLRAPGETAAIVLAAADPAQPYGAALAWPSGIGADGAEATHRPSRKAGSVVALVDGEPVIYLERGGRTVLRFTDDADALREGAGALAAAIERGALGTVHVQRADGGDVDLRGPLADALSEAGFRLTPRGLRLRSS